MPLRRKLVLVVVPLAAGLLAGCGGGSKPTNLNYNPAIRLTAASTCAQWLPATPGPNPSATQTAIVSRTGGTENLAARAEATWSVCNSLVNGLSQGATPVSSVIKMTGVTCDQWLKMSLPDQEALAKSMIGSTNLALRVAGATASCITNANQNGLGDEPVASELFSTAAAWPTPVHVNLAKLPPTRSPDDPHECMEREAAVSGTGTAALIQAGDADCVAMGF